MYYAFASQNVKTMVSMQEENIPADPAIDLSRSNSLYQDGLNEVRVNALFGLNLIKAFYRISTVNRISRDTLRLISVLKELLAPVHAGLLAFL